MHISRLWSRVPILLGICVLPWTLPGAVNLVRGEGSTVSQNQDSETDRPRVKRQIKQRNEERPAARTNVPYGISAVNSIDAKRVGQLFDTNNPTLNAYTNPNTSGVTFRTSWADVEPNDGKFDFSKIDAVFANAEKNSKWVELILIPGFGTPSWAMQGVQSGTFTVAYGLGSGTLLQLPVPWDQTYLSRWFTFLKAIGERYAGSSSAVCASKAVRLSPYRSMYARRDRPVVGTSAAGAVFSQVSLADFAPTNGPYAVSL